ncbi:MAG: ABC transporter permease [SAR324 cluster bacterium]|nr:ABC transporter permease [SAR324 cluster bacterium]
MRATLGIVLLIAGRELQSYFKTYSGYVILAAYLLISGLLFNIYAVGAETKYSQDVLRDFFYFSSGMALVASILLAMRLIAEERQIQTLVLLQTSPVSEREIVWGKYLSALAFYAVMLIVSLYMPALIFVYGKVSVLQILTGYFGLLLLGSACIAIVLLASVWSGSQLVAGVTGAVMVALLVIAWMLGRITDEPLKGLMAYLALHNIHFRTFSRGTLHLRDVVYYAAVTVFFLECAVRSLESRIWRE